MNFSERLRKMREKKYSQEELADMLNVSNITISRWENGAQEPRAKKLTELARILGTTTTYLLGDTDMPLDEHSDTANLSETISVPKDNDTAKKELVYEWGGDHRLALPNTPETREMFERLVMRSMTSQAAMA